MLINSTPIISKTAPEHPEYQSYPVTPSDSADLPPGPDTGSCRGLYIGGAGNVNVNLLGGGTAVLTALAAGQYVVCGVTRVLSTNTTATGIMALY